MGAHGAGQQLPQEQQQQQPQEQQQQEQKQHAAEHAAVCAICYDVHAHEDMVYAASDAPGSSSAAAAPACGHLFCFDCVRQHVCACIGSSKYPVQCPSFGCRQALANQDVIRLLRDSPADLERYTRLKVERSIHPSQRVYCPHEDCSTLFPRPDDGEPEGPTACPACERTMCTKCLIPGWHEGFTCKAFQALPSHLRSADDAALNNLSAALHWKKCPSCSHVVERIDGCNHVCCRCGQSFCYSCGLAYRSRAPTAANVHGTPACTCGLFAVPAEERQPQNHNDVARLFWLVLRWVEVLVLVLVLGAGAPTWCWVLGALACSTSWVLR